MIDYHPPAHTGLTILYQDDSLIVVDKPSGLLSVPGRGADKQDCMISRVQAEFPGALTVHRLDMGTSGIMVIARGKAMERALSILFQTRQVHKRYVAVVAGQVAEACGEINLPLITDWPNRPRQIVSFELGKPSSTRYQVLEQDAVANTTRVELEPITGRTHQLRVHLQALGHPILGDELYASAEILAQAPRLLLHAACIHFPHPPSGTILTIRSPIPF
ncbi:RluA family pseudouridine synthase [Thiothrix lacustris]|uniref:RluA family pseudouridine synthase n=1 Tax=Thiothrix lacustris TaxID=525917 RepID=UPI0027E4B7FD|nr:RluA family pseudouridine synthase [Thiothrix lacustris]WMP16805.1 RluA family pseudouridine synthase [Thiothrix lacustris]